MRVAIIGLMFTLIFYEISLAQTNHETPVYSQNYLSTADFAVHVVEVLVLIATGAFVYHGLFLTRRSIHVQTYFEVISDINSKQNAREIEVLDSMLLLANGTYNHIAKELARSITNRYEVVSHMVESGFIEKRLVLENYSSSFLRAYRLTIAYIQQRRGTYNNVLYLRRNFEKIALESWLFQIRNGLKESIQVISGHNGAIATVSPSGKQKILTRLKYLKVNENKIKKRLEAMLSESSKL